MVSKPCRSLFGEKSMADVDQLSILIQADATKAESAIDGLIASLRTLNTNLDLGNLKHFTDQLKEISDSAKGIKGIGNDIKSIADAGSKLAGLTGFKTLNDQMRETEETADRLANEVGKSFNFGDTKAGVQRVENLKNAMLGFFEVMQKGTDSDISRLDSTAVNSWSDSIMKASRTIIPVTEDLERVADYVKTITLHVDEDTKAWLKHEGILKEVQSVFKGVTTELGKGNSIHDMTEELDKMGVAAGQDGERIKSILEIVRQYKEELSRNTVRGRDQITAGLIDESAFKEAAQRLVDNLHQAYDEIYKTEGKKDVFGGIIPSLKELSTITMPDFSGIGVLADGLSRLSHINASKIAAIVNALHGISGANLGNTSGLAEQAQKVAGAIDGAKTSDGALKTMADNAQQASRAVALLTDKMHGFSGYTKSIETAAEMFDRLARSISMDMFSKMGTSFAQIANPSIANVVADVTASYKELEQSLLPMKDALSSLGDNSGLDAAEHTALALRDDFAETAKAAWELQQRMIDLVFPIKPDNMNIGELKDMQAGLDKFADSFAKSKDYNLDPIAESLDKTAASAEKASEKMSEFEQNLRMILDNGISQTGLSSELAKTLDLITALKQDIHTMESNTGVLDYNELVRCNKELNTAEQKLAKIREDITRQSRVGSPLTEEAKEAQKLQDRMYELQRLMSDMNSRKLAVDPEQYSAWRKELEKVRDRYNEIMGIKDKVEKPSKNIDILASFVAFAHELQSIAQTLDHFGDLGIKGLKLAFKPLDMVFKEYKEKIESIGDAFKAMADKAKRHIDKLSAFWKRSMKTFTFMLVRKAITAVLTELSDAIKSLALWSKQFGTIFNDSMSQITSNFSYIARAIIGAAEPIINALVPAFNMLADAIAAASAKVAEFFAALMGQDYYMVAVRQVTDYAESVEKAQKAQKNLIAGLDDLNIITTPTSTANGMDDVAEQWKKMDVGDTMKGWVDKIKEIARKLFDPIKKAWDNVGEHVKEQFAFMVNNIKKLLADIAEDFLEVWSTPLVQGIIEKILKIIGNLAEGIGWIAKRFDEAWEKADVGKRILTRIAEIVDIIATHVLNMSDAFVEWAKGLNFTPLLEELESLLKSIQPLVDFIFGLIEDYWERVVLRHWKWLIEEGLPHIGKTIERVLAAFDFEDLRKKLQPLLDAFETMRENIETGIVNALGNLGERIGKFTQSEDFANFLKTVEWFMNQITAERVEKLFTALGTAVLNVSESLMKFVGSEKFQDFIQKLLDWYDGKSVDDLADILTKIATAIAAFKFVAFVGKGFSNFISLLTLLTSGKGALKNAGEFLKGIKNALKGGWNLSGTLMTDGLAAFTTTDATTAATGIMTKLSGALKLVGGVILKGAFVVAIATGIAMVINNWDKIEPVLSQLAQAIFRGIGKALGGLARFIGEQIVEALKNVWKYFKDSAEEVGGNIILGILYGIAKAIIGIPVWIYNNVVLPFINGFKEGFDSHSPARVMIPIGMDIINGLLSGILEIIAGIGEWLMTHVVQPILDFFAGAGSWLIESGKALIQGFIDGVDELKGNAYKQWEKIRDGVVEIAENLRKDLEDKWDELNQNAQDAWDEVKSKAEELWDKIKTSIVERAEKTRDELKKKWDKVKEEAASAWNSVKTTAIQKWSEIRNSIVSTAENIHNTLVGVWNNVKTTAETTWNNIWTSAESIWSGIKSTIVGFAQTAAEEASHKFWDLVDWASDAFWGVVNAAGNILGNVPSTISNALRGVKSAVTGAFNNAGTWLTGVGTDIANGLTGGIESATTTNTFYNNTASLSDALVNITNRKLDRHSPSKVFMEIGEDVVRGLNIGIEDEIGDAEKSLKKLYNGMMSVKMPQLDFSQTLPKDNLKMDSYQHFSGTASLDNTGIQESVRSGVMDAVGSLILPYLNDIAQSSRETANKELRIGDKQIGQSAQRYARDFQTRTGKPAYA